MKRIVVAMLTAVLTIVAAVCVAGEWIQVGVADDGSALVDVLSGSCAINRYTDDGTLYIHCVSQWSDGQRWTSGTVETSVGYCQRQYGILRYRDSGDNVVGELQVALNGNSVASHVFTALCGWYYR